MDRKEKGQAIIECDNIEEEEFPELEGESWRQPQHHPSEEQEEQSEDTYKNEYPYEDRNNYYQEHETENQRKSSRNPQAQSEDKAEWNKKYKHLNCRNGYNEEVDAEQHEINIYSNVEDKQEKIDIKQEKNLQQHFYSKEQSYVYSKESSPEKQAREYASAGSCGGIMNFNSYQQKHRLLQRISESGEEVQIDRHTGEHGNWVEQEELEPQEEVEGDEWRDQTQTKEGVVGVNWNECGLKKKDEILQKMQHFTENLQEALQETQREVVRLKSDNQKVRAQWKQETDARTLIQVDRMSSNVEKELYRQIDNLNLVIDSLRRKNQELEGENKELKANIERVIQESKDLKYRLNSEIELLSIQNRKGVLNQRAQQENYEYIAKNHELNYKLEILRKENIEFERINNVQLQDIKILIEEKEELQIKLNELFSQTEIQAQETSRKYEQLKFDLAKEYSHKLNKQIQDIHYKSHVKVEKYKSIIQEQAQKQVQPSHNQNNYSRGYDPHYSQNNLDCHLHSMPNEPSKRSMHITSVPTMHTQSGDTRRSMSPHMSRNPQRESEKTLFGKGGAIERRVILEICGMLKQNQVELLPKMINDMKNANRNLQKLSDCIVQMVVSCHPSGFFGQEDQQPTLKQSWKWLKNIMEEYILLKRGSNLEQQISNMLGVNNYIEVQSVLADKLAECTIANRVFKKISMILKLKQFNTIIEFEQAIDQLEQDDINASTNQCYSS